MLGIWHIAHFWKSEAVEPKLAYLEWKVHNFGTKKVPNVINSKNENSVQNSLNLTKISASTRLK